MRWSRTDTLALLAVTLLAGAIRLARVADPGEVIFDETYYAKDACFYTGAPAAVCGTAAEQTAVHPPLGKLLIAAGVRWLGYNSLGWRIASVIAGTLTVALLYALARRVLRSTAGASVAAGLLAFDLLHFVQSRTAMLDVFVPLFGVAAFLFVVLDHDRQQARQTAEPGGPSFRGAVARPWLLAAGLASGAAVASKWSGVLFGAAVILLSVAGELAAGREEDARSARPILERRAGASLKRRLGTLRSEGPSVVVYLVIVPLVTYAASYIGRLDGAMLALPWSRGSWLRALFERQLYMADFHLGLEATHSYQSPAWSWMLLKRPVSYYFDTAPNGDYKEVLAAGSPLVWWASLAALLFVAVRWIVKRGAFGAEGVILTGFLVTYGPWLIPFSDRSAVFLFYLLPCVPFMCLALGYVACTLGRSLPAKGVVTLFLSGAIGLFAWYYPLTANVAIPYEDWDARLWIFDHCDKPPGAPVTETVTTTVDGTQTTKEETGNSSDDLPPPGWCWR